MIKKPIGYDEAATLGTGDFEEITVGGHVCIIKTAHEDVRNGKRYLVLLFDIAPEDAQGGYYTRLYNRRVQSLQNKDDGVVRWPGTYWQGLEGKSTAFFKGLISSIEKSNPGYSWNWDEKTLKGKKFGGVFGREQYIGRDGTPHWSTKCLYARSVDGIADVEPPEDKPISSANYEGYSQPASIPAGYTPVDEGDDRLPF